MATRVSDLMTHALVTLREEDNLEQVLESMERLGLRHLPVVDGERLVGLFSHRDALRHARTALFATGSHQEQTFIHDVMTRDVIAVAPDAPIGEAARIMAEKRFGCLPVVEGERLVGIVTETDLLAYLAKHHRDE